MGMKEDLEKLNKKSTKGFHKIRNYFVYYVLKNEKFQKTITKIRTKYDIAPRGYNYEEHENYIKNSHPFIPPPSWNPKDKDTVLDSIRDEIKLLCKEFNLFDPRWYEITWNYLFYNNADTSLDLLLYDYDLCEILDVPEESFIQQDPEFGNIFKELDINRDYEFPVAIRISPYASKRGILEFIEKNSKFIKRIQEKYKREIYLGKIRKRNPLIQKRNEFIYKNRHLPKKMIVELVKTIFRGKLIVGYSEISKIISLEEKIRKEV